MNTTLYVDFMGKGFAGMPDALASLKKIIGGYFFQSPAGFSWENTTDYCKQLLGDDDEVIMMKMVIYERCLVDYDINTKGDLEYDDRLEKKEFILNKFFVIKTPILKG